MSNDNRLATIGVLVAADIRLFFLDRRAVIINLITPLVIAGLFGLVFGGGSKAPQGRLAIAVIDLDHSKTSQAVRAGLGAEKALEVSDLDLATAREQVQKGKVRAAIVLNPGFGAAAGKAFLGAAPKPRVPVLYDPSQTATLAMVQGLLTQQVFAAVSGDLFSGEGGAKMIDESLASLDSQGLSASASTDLRELLTRARSLNQRNRADAAAGAGASGTRGGLSTPFELTDEPVTSGRRPYNSFAHATAGMGVQFILMMGIEAGVGLLLLRRRGLWLRLRAAPLARGTMLAARVGATAARSLVMLLVLYVGAMLFFGVRIDGSVPGFIGVALAFALTTAAFGLLVAALGRTPDATRGIAIFATLVMVMLGGGWVPAFLFPEWLQGISAALPTRWAIDGLEAMTWRGLGIAEAGAAIAALLAFTLAFLAIAVWRFRWQEVET
ncbi:MAG: ABC transporter permease [Gammaproteobacteria bacterium]|nr:ABC transporter permease [Gammaproteobacteria bacterium]